MSLFTEIKQNTVLYEKVAILLKYRDRIKTVSGKEPFGKAYRLYRKNKFNPERAAILGNAFDLYARLLIAKELKWDFKKFLSVNNYSYLTHSVKALLKTVEGRIINNHISSLEILFDDNINDLDFLRYVVNISGLKIKNDSLTVVSYDLLDPQDKLLEELSYLGEFFKRYINIFKDENIKMNYSFTDKISFTNSYIDVIAKDYIIDFKTTLNNEFDEREWLQLFCYALTVNLPVKGIGIYRASFAELEYLPFNSKIIVDLEKVIKEMKL